MDGTLLRNTSVFLNESVDIENPAVKANLLVYDFLVPAIGVLIIITNLAVVISSGLLLKKGQQPKSTYLFLGNVALTDLFTGIAVVFGQVFPKAYRDHYVCSIQIGMIVSNTLASVFSVGLIAIDRYLYILYGLKYQKWVFPGRARLSIVFTWIIGCFIGFLPLMGWYGYTDNGRICWFILLAPKELILLTVFVGIIPLLIVIILYSIILFHALKKIFQIQQMNVNPELSDEENPTKNLRMFRGKSNQIDSEEDSENNSKKGFFQVFTKKPSVSVKTPNMWKAIKVVLFTTGSFIITWSPYFITSLLYAYNCDFNTETKYCKSLRVLIASPLAILGFMNSFLNPIIYAWWHKGFRHFVKKRFSVFSMKDTNLNQSSQSNQTKSTSSSRKTSTCSDVNSKVVQENPS